MSRSFHRKSDTYEQREIFFSRDKARKVKHHGRGTDESDQIRREHIEAQEWVEALIKRVSKSSIKSITFAEKIRAQDEDIERALRGDTLQIEFPLIQDEESEHPIFSYRSERLLDATLAPNPSIIFNEFDDAPLLLEYDPEAGKMKEVPRERIEEIRIKVQAYLKSLFPSEEEQRIMETAWGITHGVKQKVSALDQHIQSLVNNALSKKRKGKSPRQ